MFLYFSSNSVLCNDCLYCFDITLVLVAFRILFVYVSDLFTVAKTKRNYFFSSNKSGNRQSRSVQLLNEIIKDQHSSWLPDLPSLAYNFGHCSTSREFDLISGRKEGQKAGQLSLSYEETSTYNLGWNAATPDPLQLFLNMCFNQIKVGLS